MNKEHDLKVLRHSAAHLLAHTIKELYPKTLLTIGPATEEGFFYDFLPEHNFKEEDLRVIEDRMRMLSEQNLPIEHKEITKKEAEVLYADNPFKLELIRSIAGDTVGLSVQGDFFDLCRGGHVASTGQIKYFKLLTISGSYWRADKANQRLQRINGTAFFSQQELDDFYKQREEAILYDHRRLGKQLDLFSFHEEGVGFPFFHAKGKIIFNTLVAYMRSIHEANDYQEIATPTILSDELWRRSGHYAHYKDNMYFTCVEDQSYAIKPMNCPGSMLVYQTRPRSYRELPLRLAEFGHVHRHELSGVLHGLLRVRAFTIDDTHIYCMLDQVEEEILKIISIIKKVLAKFGFHTLKFGLSTKPANAMGGDVVWQRAIAGLRNALVATDTPFELKEGEGAFYGPKIEVIIQDSMKREWQCSTIQLDFFAAENFDLHYVTSQGTQERPILIHQAVYGSLERFIAILLEHYKGHLPFWLSPIQIKAITVTDAQKPYAQTIVSLLKNDSLRIELDTSSEPLSAKIRNAQLEKLPLMLIMGKKEVENNTITLRYNDGQQEQGLDFDAVKAIVNKLNQW